MFDVRDGRFNAWGKAPGDIARILGERFGCRVVQVPNRLPSCGASLFRRIWTRLVWETTRLRFFLRLPRRDFVVLQGHFVFFYRFMGYTFLRRILRLKKCRFCIVVHDLPGHLTGDDFSEYALPSGFVELSERSDGVIVHNPSMLEWFAQRGVDREKLVPLGLFDYLCTARREPVAFSRDVIYAGNISPDKSPFLLQLGEISSVRWLLYGTPSPMYPGAQYMGSFPPDELPSHLKGGFGLVWDGDSVDTCSGGTGEYLLYNNPHKMSLYLASDLPVITWRKAATAPFVEANGVGILVDSLRELPGVLASIDEARYAELAANAAKMGAKLRSGFHTLKAVEHCLAARA